MAVKKNWYKGLTATAIAMAMAGAVSAPVFAIDYDIANGNVYVDGNFSWQEGNAEWNANNKYDHTAHQDNDVNIIQNPNGEGEKTSTENSVTVSGDASGLDITVDGVNAEVNGDGDAFLTIDEDAKADVTIKDTDITLNGNNTSGILVDAGADATLTFEGDNTISAGEATKEGYDNILDEINGSTNTTVNMEGISIGGGASDADGSSNGEGASVTITTDTDDSSLTIDGVGAGIVVRRNSDLTIDGNGLDNSVENALDITISNTLNVNSTVSGNGITNYGDLTITDDASLEIYGNKDSKHGGHIGKSNGITSNVTNANEETGTVTISNGANVDIHDISGTGIYMESYAPEKAADLIVNDASLTIKNAGENGIVADHTNITVENGAKVTISDVGKQGIQMGTNSSVKKPYTNRFQDFIIRGEDTVVSIDVKPENEAVNLNYGKDLFLYDNAKLNITNGSIAIYSLSNVIVENAILNARDIYFYSNWGRDYEGYSTKLEIRNNAKVTADRIFEWLSQYNGNADVIVIGGTLNLRASGGKGLTSDAYERLYDTDKDGSIMWPTNGSAYGNEKLVNFQLTRDQLHALIHAYGLKDGKAVAYSKELVDALGSDYSDWYTIDLSKYDADEKLSVWVPAVILSYYYQNALPEGKTFENMTDAEWQDFLNNLQQGTDIIIRGESVGFATLGNKPSENLNRTGIDWWNGALDGVRQNPLPGFDANTPIIAQNTAWIIGLDTVVTPPDPTPTPTPNPDPDPDPDPEPPVIIPEDPTPLVPDVPVTPDEPVIEIPDDETPLAPSVPDQPSGLEEIEDEVTPLANVPKTGAVSSLPGSVFAAAVAMLLGKKRRRK